MGKKYYVVWQGKTPGIYDSWPQAQAQVQGRSNAKYMGFTSYQQAADAYRRPYTHAVQARQNGNSSDQKKSASRNQVKDQSKSTIKNSADINIYSDGACSPNPGESGTGLAIYYQNTLNSLWFGLYEEQGTNNSAELYGLLEAFKAAQPLVKQNLSVQILSDSKYSIDCITRWAPGWKRNDWRRANHEPIKNLPLIQSCHQLYEELRDRITITHVRGHADIEGNELADRMAVFARNSQQVSLISYAEPLDIQTILAMPSG